MYVIHVEIIMKMNKILAADTAKFYSTKYKENNSELFPDMLCKIIYRPIANGEVA